MSEFGSQSDLGLIDELNEKLLTIEKEKQVLFLQLKKVESIIETEAKLAQAE